MLYLVIAPTEACSAMRLSFACAKLHRIPCALLELHVQGAGSVKRLRSMLGRLEYRIRAGHRSCVPPAPLD
eukprot:49000-Eustigmatos_ZCMA.PRE.1